MIQLLNFCCQWLNPATNDFKVQKTESPRVFYLSFLWALVLVFPYLPTSYTTLCPSLNASASGLGGETDIYNFIIGKERVLSIPRISSSKTELEKVSFHSNPKERQCQRISNYRIIALISHTSKVILKILQVRFRQYMNHELPDVQAGFRKGRGTRDQIANIRWIIKNQENSRKTSISAFLTMPKPLTV